MSDSSEADKTEFTEPTVMRAKARVGQVLKNKWRLDILLGVGGMAAVYAATHRNGSRAAVKLLHPELSTNALVRARFLREGYVANAVGHEGAVKVIDDDEAEDDSLYLVTELLDGETLEDRRLRHGGCLDVGEVLCLTDRILDVLAAAHAKGIVHRDIKPDNVFITRAGQVKVIDFGIARLREARATKSATRSGVTMGTPAFMPPEQARGLWDEVDARSDLWALGATMVNLLTSRLLHEARSVNEQMMYSMTKKSPSLESMLSGANHDVCRIVNRALAFDKNHRWRDARRMQDAVRGAYYSIYGHTIDGATRMSVPDSVPNRTLPGSKTPTPAPREQTTARPVESISRNVPTVAKLRRSRLTAAALITGAAALGVALTAAVWMVTASSRQDAAATPAAMPVRVTEAPALAADPSASAPQPTATLLAPAASTLPTFTLPPLPSAGIFGHAVAPATSAAHAPAASSSHPRPTTAASATPALPPSPYPPPVVLPPSPYPPPSPYRAVSCDPPFTIDLSTGQKHFKNRVPMNRILAALLLGVIVLVGARSARGDEPTKQECVAANDAAQTLRRAGKLREARGQFAICVSTSCPWVVQQDCTDRVREIDTAMPTVVFSITDRDGLARTRVKITMDDAPLDWLDGRSLPIDPGHHRFGFEAQDAPYVEETVDVLEGDKGRQVSVVLGTRAVVRAAPISPLPSSSSTPSIAAFSAGGAGLLLGAVFAIEGANAKTQANSACGAGGDQCPGDAGSRNSAIRLDTALAFTGFGIAVAGAVGGALLLPHAPPASPRTGRRVFPVLGAGFAGVGGRF